MKALRFICGLACALGLDASAQEAPSFLTVAPASQGELRIRMKGTVGQSYRLEVSTNLSTWTSLMSFRGAASVETLDSSAPFLPSRYYRIQQMNEPNPFIGDHLPAQEGDIVVRPINHASFVFRWNGKTVYNDPVGGAALYASYPRPDLILVSHNHGDHFDASTLAGIRAAGTWIITPAMVYTSLSSTLKAQAIPLSNGAVTNIQGIEIEAVPAYNSRHPKGTGNGYVVTAGGKKLYMCGDTEDVAEMRALRDIDMAFLCMNSFTMTVAQAASAAREFRPKIVYPYHYSGSDVNVFKRNVGTDLGIEVRLRNWY